MSTTLTIAPRVLAGLRRDGAPATLGQHVASYGRNPDADPAAILAAVEGSGLRGRGGGAFPTGAKLRAVRAVGGHPLVVANGCEGEPLSLKDKLLLRALPHLVLDGAVLAAQAVGAREAMVAVAETAAPELAAVERALAERRRARVDPVAVRLFAAPEGFVVGEETALVAWLSGREAKPTLVPPRPHERGVKGRPTLVQNVETLAQLALVARFGAAWFRELGTQAEPGSALATVAGAVRRPGVYEVAFGCRIQDLVDRAGGATEAIGAFLIGGYFGTWLPAALSETRLLEEELRPHGASLGACAVVALPAAVCGVAESARVGRWLARESAGQCGPCVHGLAAAAAAFERLARGDASELRRLHRWIGQIRGRGACRHPDGASRFLASALEVFGDEVELHRTGRCSGLRASAVLPGLA